MGAFLEEYLVDVTDSEISQLLILPGWSSTLIMVSKAVLSIKVFLAYISVKWYICIGLNLFCHNTFPQIVFEVRIFTTFTTLEILCLLTWVFLKLLWSI